LIDVRLFIAINFSESVRHTIWEATSALRAGNYPVRWVARDLVHLTLKFLGDVDGEQQRDIEQALSAAVETSRAFVLPVRGAGAFPNPRDPRVIWIGCEPVPTLELIQHAVERNLGEVGFALERRPFRPHVTVGRVKRDARRRAFSGFAAELDTVEVDEAPLVESIDLMQSHLGPKGPKYDRLFAADLSP
jgi:2'-5' RNA ligase